LIAVDTSSWIAFFTGKPGADLAVIDEALSQGAVVLPPVVLTELLSDPEASKTIGSALLQIPLLSIQEGYWERAGLLRSKILARGRKARLADVLIAQSCLDVSIPLLTRDADFRHFARWAGLELLVPS
jgi:predicted nucleic acid-binding protein